jgi:hypothetical protein
MSNPSVTSPKEVTIKDKTFTIRIPTEKIQSRVKDLAEIISRDYEGLNPHHHRSLKRLGFFCC